jgi:hypothetical protein
MFGFGVGTGDSLQNAFSGGFTVSPRDVCNEVTLFVGRASCSVARELYLDFVEPSSLLGFFPQRLNSIQDATPIDR